LLLARRGAEKARARREEEREQSRAERKAGRTARAAGHLLGQARRAAKGASKRVRAEAAARLVAGLAPFEHDQAATQLLDLAREIADLARELAACAVELPRAGGAGRKRTPATPACGVATGGQQTKRSAASTRGDELRARLRAQLARKRSMRTRYGRRPAVFRRMRHPDTALAREWFKPASAPRSEARSGGEYLADREAEGVHGMLARLLAAVVSEGASAGLEAAAEDVMVRAVSTLLAAAAAGAAADAAVDPPGVASGRCAGVARVGVRCRATRVLRVPLRRACMHALRSRSRGCCAVMRPGNAPDQLAGWDAAARGRRRLR
jgi:hypothetical protein